MGLWWRRKRRRNLLKPVLSIEGMSADAYQRWTRTTAVYPKSVAQTYLVHGLTSEAGEVAALYKRALRDGKTVTREALRDELGDVLWYVARLADESGIELSEVMRMNHDKLEGRVSRGTLRGKGGSR